VKPLSIQVRGFFLDVTGSIRFRLVNPMFQRESIPGISVFPFDLPGTPGNKRLLQYFNLAEDVQNINSVDAVIYLYGNIFLRGVLKYKWVKDHFEADFSQIMKLYDNKDALLSTLTLGTYDMGNQAGYGLFYDYIKDRSLDGWAGDKDIVFFPQYNPSLFKNKDALQGTPSPYVSPYDTVVPEQYIQYVNYWDYHEPTTGSPDIVDFWFRSIGTPDRINDLIMSPSYYIKFLLTKIFTENDFPIIESPDFLDVEDIAQLVMTTDKFFRMRLNLTAPFGTAIYLPFFLDFTDFVFRQSAYLPDLTIFNFLNGLKNTFNLSFFFGQIDGKVEILHNESLLQDEAYEEWTHKCFILHEKEANLIDSITFKYSRSDDALYTSVNTLRGRTILASVATYTSLPTVSERGKVCLVMDENKYYEQEYGLSGLEWKLYSQENTDYSAEGVLELESNSDTWHTADQEDQLEGVVSDNVAGTGGYGGKKVWRIPMTEVAGNSDRFGLTKKSEGHLRLLFYRGMSLYVDHYNFWVSGNTDPIYPYASSDNRTTIGGTSGLSLQWEGEDGLYNRWWSKWVELLKNEVPIRRVVNLGINDILNFNFKKKKMIDGVKYFVKEGDVVVSNEKGIEPAVFDFLRVHYNANAVEFTPASIANLAFWLKADAGLTLSGSDVTQWDDQSGNNRHFVWDTIKPKFNATFANGKEYVYADTLNMKMKLTYTEQYRTVFVLFKGSNSSNSAAGSFAGLGNICYQINADYCQIGIDSSNLFGYGAHYYAYMTSGVLDAGAIDQNINIITVVAGASSTKTYFNGALVASNTNDMNNCSGDHFLFSSGVPGTDYTFQGGIRELINYNRALTALEIAEVNAYLITRS